MDATKLISFLGFTSIHEPFDNFLLSYKMKKRPQPGDSPYKMVEKKMGLSLTFEDDVEGNEIERKSPGIFVFSSAYFSFKGDGYTPFSGTLPFSLVQTDTPAEVEHKLGKPREIDEDDGYFASYFHRGLVVSVRYSDKKKGGLEFVRVSLPTKYHRQRHVAD